jgi:beta-galactosidase/beta-glucuronidase
LALQKVTVLIHYRFHSWCPPQAAFEAADIVGIYLQPELPIWWGFNPEDSTHIPFMMKEGKRILDNYANHASFVMFALGNEIGKDRNI